MLSNAVFIEIISGGGCTCCFFFFQAEDGIRYLVRSRGLGDVYKRQVREGGSLAVPKVEAGSLVGAAPSSEARMPISCNALSLIHI